MQACVDTVAHSLTHSHARARAQFDIESLRVLIAKLEMAQKANGGRTAAAPAVHDDDDDDAGDDDEHAADARREANE
jgi:hypothetical protein